MKESGYLSLNLAFGISRCRKGITAHKDNDSNYDSVKVYVVELRWIIENVCLEQKNTAGCGRRILHGTLLHPLCASSHHQSDAAA